MSRIRLIMLSVLAALAVSAVASASASAAHIWLVNGAEANGQEVLGLGGVFKLTAGAKVIECKHVHSIGTVGPSDKDLALRIHFLECTTSEAGCIPLTHGAPAGLILVLNVPTLLTLKENANKENTLADEFKGAGPGGEFVTLLFKGVCTTFPTTKVTGNISAVVENGTQSLNFPGEELKGNTLKAFGVAAKLEGKTKQTLTLGGTLLGD